MGWVTSCPCWHFDFRCNPCSTPAAFLERSKPRFAGTAAGVAEGQGEQLARCQQRCQAFPALHRHLELLEAEALEADSFAPAPASGIIFASFYAQGDRGTEARPTAQGNAFCS